MAGAQSGTMLHGGDRLTVFLLGAAGYPVLELLFRGRTHYSMALAGGMSALALRRIRRMPVSLGGKAVLGACAITGVEAVCGFLWNKKHCIWDYRAMPMNWRGQICLPYTLLWGVLSSLWMLLDKAPGKA